MFKSPSNGKKTSPLVGLTEKNRLMGKVINRGREKKLENQCRGERLLYKSRVRTASKEIEEERQNDASFCAGMAGGGEAVKVGGWDWGRLRRRGRQRET